MQMALFYQDMTFKLLVKWYLVSENLKALYISKKGKFNKQVRTSKKFMPRAQAGCIMWKLRIVIRDKCGRQSR